MLALLLTVAQAKPFAANAELGKPYRVGVDRFVIGTKQKLEPIHWRTITLQSVRTAHAFGAQGENIVAEAGQKLILLDFNIKNPVKRDIRVSTSDTLRVRVWEADQAKLYRYIRATLRDGGTLSKTLKAGESIDVTIILSAPERTPFVHLGFAYERGSEGSTRWYDIVPIAKKSTSPFSTDGFNFGPSARGKADAPIEIEGLRATFGRPVKKADHYAMTVTYTNTLRMPVSWGWQYASTDLQFANGTKVAAYRAVYEPGTDTMWGGQLAPGETRALEYRFYSPPDSPPSQLTMQLETSKRSVIISDL